VPSRYLGCLNMRINFQAEAELIAKQALAVDWVAAACVTCLLYDHVLTLGQECSTVWSTRFSLGKVLFLINRYLVEAMLVFDSITSSRSHLSIPFCVFYLRWLAVVTSVAIIVVEAILTIRVCALYQSNKPVLCIASFFFLAGACTLVGLTVKDYVGEPVDAVNDFSMLPGCYATSVPSILAGWWITPVIVESVLFLLMITRVFTWWKDRRTVPPMLILMARDSTIYFAIYFALLIANLFVFEYGPPALASLLVTPLNTGGCIAGSRMLLNLRAYASAGPEQTEMATSVAFAGSPPNGRRPHPHVLTLERALSSCDC